MDWEPYRSFTRKAWPQFMGAAMMAAPVAFDLTRTLANIVFFGAALFGAGGLALEIWWEATAKETGRPKRRLFSICGIAGGALALSMAAFYFWPHMQDSNGSGSGTHEQQMAHNQEASNAKGQTNQGAADRWVTLREV